MVGEHDLVFVHHPEKPHLLDRIDHRHADLARGAVDPDGGLQVVADLKHRRMLPGDVQGDR